MSIVAKSKFNRYGAIPFLVESFLNEANKMKEVNVPQANIYQDNDAYYAELAIPGVAKEDIKIEVNNHVLKISSHVKEEKLEEKTEGQNENKVQYFRKEFGFQTFQRSFPLPEGKVNTEAIDAKYENGVLTVTVPKNEVAKDKGVLHIEVK